MDFMGNSKLLVYKKDKELVSKNGFVVKDERD
jgi:hypothetical protein